MIGYNKPFKGIIYSYNVPDVSYPLDGTIYRDDQKLCICTSKVIACRYIARDTFIIETMNSVYIVIVE